MTKRFPSRFSFPFQIFSSVIFSFRGKREEKYIRCFPLLKKTVVIFGSIFKKTDTLTYLYPLVRNDRKGRQGIHRCHSTAYLPFRLIYKNEKFVLDQTSTHWRDVIVPNLCNSHLDEYI